MGLMGVMGLIGLMGYAGLISPIKPIKPIMPIIYIVLCAAASLSGEAAGCGDEALPDISTNEGQVFGHDAFPDEGAGKAGIEAVAGTDCAHHIFYGRCLEVVAAAWGTYDNLPCARRANEERTIAAYIHIIYIARVARGKHHFNVIGTASDDCALPEVLKEDWHEKLQFVLVVAAEVDVVIDDGTCLSCTVE